jgi:hypothetical protein
MKAPSTLALPRGKERRARDLGRASLRTSLVDAVADRTGLEEGTGECRPSPGFSREEPAPRGATGFCVVSECME